MAELVDRFNQTKDTFLVAKLLYNYLFCLVLKIIKYDKK